ncbi:Hypothetical protein NGAL_HAMBI1146_58670 [Neorhizobium galegae bv. officinalis]|nr:Hypothetical protein NGAL_HAMBI1146_58670 [Neorhizobium galegae bv. officinalis]
MAVRIAAVQALRGKTLVGDNVLDSEIGALQVDADGNLRTDEDTPFLAIYTDAATTRDIDIDIRSFSVNGVTEILFETGITAAMTETDAATDETKLIGLGIPATDRSFELFLDLVDRQIGDVLNDPANEWAGIFRNLVQRFVKIDRARTSGAADGTRLAGHQTKVSALLVNDPVAGEAIRSTGAIGKFFAKAAELTEPEIVTQLAAMRAQIEGSGVAWATPVRRRGLTQEEGAAMLVDDFTDDP